MWIRKIELTNFQKHSKLVLNFTSEVNAIYGATDSGKSCVRRAIEWVVFNKTLRNDGIRKENTKQTSVKITLDNNTIIERIRSNSINRYLLTVDGDTQQFDSIGKTIPEPIKEALGVSAITIDKEEIVLNIANQISLPFLLDKSGTFRMKLFNKITGNDVVDDVLQSFNRDILGISKKEKIQSENLTNRKLEKTEIDNALAEKKKMYLQYKKIFDIIQNKIDKFNKLNDYSKKIEDLQTEKNKIIVKDKIEISDSTIENLKNKITKIEKLYTNSSKIKQVDKDKQNILDKLSGFKLPEINLDKLFEIVSKFEKLLKLNQETEGITIRKKQLNEDLQRANDIKNDWIKKYKTELSKNPQCPTCKQKLNSKTISEIEL